MNTRWTKDMGILRLILALSVIIAHTTPIFGLRILEGPLAVQSFYLISGFYMEMIMKEKYFQVSPIAFYVNRFLRIFPTYWLLLIATLIVSGLLYLRNGNPGPLLSYAMFWKDLQPMTWIVLLFANTCVIGQDIVMFMGLHVPGGQLFLTKNFWITSPRLHSFLLIPQAWSISLELMFYTLVPWLTRLKTHMLIVIILCSLLARRIGILHGFDFDPWTYRFFPFELSVFLAGMLAYRYLAHFKLLTLSNVGVNIVVGMLILLTLVYSKFQLIPGEKQLIYLAILFTSIPSLFAFTNRWKIDRFIGNLSYPIYLSHILILTCVEAASKILPQLERLKGGIGISFISILVAIGIELLFNKNVERIKAWVMKHAQKKKVTGVFASR